MFSLASGIETPDVGENILMFMSERRRESDEKGKRSDLVRLRYKLSKLKERQAALRAKLLQGSSSIGIATHPHLGYRLMQGVWVDNKSHGPDSMALVFSPSFAIDEDGGDKGHHKGRIAGPYDVVLTRGPSGSIRVASHVLPEPGDKDLFPAKRQFTQPLTVGYLEKQRLHRGKTAAPVVDIEQLEAKHFTGKGKGSDDEAMEVEEGAGPSPPSTPPAAKIDQFALEVLALLSAYVRRLRQVKQVIDKFPDDQVQDIYHSRRIDKVSFKICLQDGGQEVQVKMSMAYELDKIRPVPGSVKVRVGRGDVDEETRAMLLQQCNAFYDENLAQAIDLAFYPDEDDEDEDEDEEDNQVDEQQKE